MAACNWKFWLLMVGATVVLLSSCERDPDKAFKSILSDHSGIAFSNDLVYTENLNAYTYRNFYNGGGVALGDINNDGLLDIYFSGNQVDNKLYLNKGNFVFEDITQTAGVACQSVWSTGVSMADVNGDGLLDIYVCKSGPPQRGIRHNELFINNGDLTFTESSKAWGVDHEGLSIHAVFFDFDNDGDLDFYLLNNSNRSVGVFDLKKGQREVRDDFGGNKFYRNEGDHFVEISKQAGIFSSAIGFGLGVSVSDVNKDGWMDIYVANDFFERDYFYINNGDGTFREVLERVLNETSMGSMGVDIADLNNDSYPEIYVTEMLPSEISRVRTKAVFESWDKYSANVESGYFRQFNRNTLQLNNGANPNDLKEVNFSEIGRFAGVHATDWSWGALLFDYDNDGLKDVFVANGIAKDLTDQDYIHFSSNVLVRGFNSSSRSGLLTGLMDTMPSAPIRNYIFKNDGGLHFTDKSIEEGLNAPTFSNGSAYGDLNNDGRLDLVVNNVNEKALVYKNLSNRENHYLQITFKGISPNTSSIGSSATLYCSTDKYFVEQSPIRGYLSSIDHKLHVGIGKHRIIDSVVVSWHRGGCSVLYGVVPDQHLIIDEGKSAKNFKRPHSTKISPLFEKLSYSFDYSTTETESFSDFNRDRLLMEMISGEGASFAIGDANRDDLDDIYVCGSGGRPGTLLMQSPEGKFTIHEQETFQRDSLYDDTQALFVDIDRDQQMDLYVGSGGNRFSFSSPQFQDRIYQKIDSKSFIRTENTLPINYDPTSFVVPLDIDMDGHNDLLVGSRSIPYYYGLPADARLLLYDTLNKKYHDVTTIRGPELIKLGLLTDACVIDYDLDLDLDIVICGHWMSPKFFKNTNGYYKLDVDIKLPPMNGLWNMINVADLNSDGFDDILLGNQGLNYLYQANANDPLTLTISDFDQNGSIEQIICKVNGSGEWPLNQLPDLWKQLPYLRKKFPNFASYASIKMSDLFSPDQLKRAKRYEVNELRSQILINKDGKGFSTLLLPPEAQYSKIYVSCISDFNSDGILDIIVGGNQYNCKPEWGIQAASYVQFFSGKENSQFEYVKPAESGLAISDEVRGIERIEIAGKKCLVVGTRNGSLKFFKIYE